MLFNAPVEDVTSVSSHDHRRKKRKKKKTQNGDFVTYSPAVLIDYTFDKA